MKSLASTQGEQTESPCWFTCLKPPPAPPSTDHQQSRRLTWQCRHWTTSSLALGKATSWPGSAKNAGGGASLAGCCGWRAAVQGGESNFEPEATEHHRSKPRAQSITKHSS